MQAFAVHTTDAATQFAIVGPRFTRAKRIHDTTCNRSDRMPARTEDEIYPLETVPSPATSTSTHADTAICSPTNAERLPYISPGPELYYPTPSGQTDTAIHTQRRKAVRANTTDRREQCRLSQARYRFKQRTKIKLLGDAISILRREISQLTVQRDQTLWEGKRSVHSVIVEYFHFFRHGVDVFSGAYNTRIGSNTCDAAQRQQVFLEYGMAPNIELGESRGVAALMDHWCQYSAYFQDLEFRLEHMNEMPKGLVIVSASLRVTVTTETIKHVFPHLSPCPSENRDVKAMLLGKKLIGAQLLLPSTLHFEWDSATRQIVRLQTSTDFLVPLCREFGNLNDAFFVLDGANITLDGAIPARGL